MVLEPGDELEPRVVEDLDGKDMKLIAALLQDPYPPHYDPKRAEELDYPGLLNQGPANISYLLQTVVEVLESPSDIREVEVRLHDMVFEGETVSARATVEDIRRTDGDRLAEFAVALEKSDGSVAVDGTVTAQLPSR